MYKVGRSPNMKLWFAFNLGNKMELNTSNEIG